MIFVTVGTTPFEGLIKAVDGIKLNEEVIIQKADGEYVPQNYDHFEYSEKFNEFLEKADVVVTHGGAGTLFQLIGMGKKVVGVANNERDDLHQPDLLRKLSDEGHIIWCQNLGELKKCIEDAKKFKPKKYTKPENKIAKTIIKKFA